MPAKLGRPHPGIDADEQDTDVRLDAISKRVSPYAQRKLLSRFGESSPRLRLAGNLPCPSAEDFMRLHHLAFVLLAAAAMGSCSKGMQSPMAPASTETKAFVTIPKSDGYYGTNATTFSPTGITINAGGTVTWINYDSEIHNPTQDDAAWTSGELAPNGQYTRTYSTPGTYSYHCEIHKEMKGTVTVK